MVCLIEPRKNTAQKRRKSIAKTKPRNIKHRGDTFNAHHNATKVPPYPVFFVQFLELRELGGGQLFNKLPLCAHVEYRLQTQAHKYQNEHSQNGKNHPSRLVTTMTKRDLSRMPSALISCGRQDGRPHAVPTPATTDRLQCVVWIPLRSPQGQRSPRTRRA